MRNCLNQLLLCLLFFAVNSCKKHESINQDPIVPYDAGTVITTAIAGKVTAQDGTALNGVEITIGTSTTITDVGGNFIIPKASINQKAGLIKATKTGYFAGSRTIVAKEKVINNIVIQLVKKTETVSFTNAAGGTITIATGGSIVFPTNAVATKTGAAYTGTVKVSAYFLDPTTANCYKEMPGDLRGINTSNNEQVLTSYGMMAVELQGSNGEVLQMATGKNATLSFPIATSIQANAPATIPLWFFDETKAMWVEQGTATKTGNNYVGSVSHFTWWNCDAGFPLVNYKIQIMASAENPLSNALVTITRKQSTTTGFWNTTQGITASNGTVTGKIPYNEVLELKIYASPLCLSNTPIYTTTIGPFTQDSDGGTITVAQNANISTAYISGTVVNCSNKPVTNGYAIITLGNDKYYGNIVNGAINKSIISCNGTLSGVANIEVFDMDSLKKNATPITLNITGSGIYSIGQVSACGSNGLIKFTAVLVYQNGRVLNSYLVKVNDTGMANSNTPGSISVILSANKTAVLKVFNYKSDCNNNIIATVLSDSIQIGPFATNFDAGNITISLPQNLNSFLIRGSVVNCNNQPIVYGTIETIIDNRIYLGKVYNGILEQEISRCIPSPTTAAIYLIDSVNNQRNLTPINVNIDNKDVNLGSNSACGLDITEYFTFLPNHTIWYSNYDSANLKFNLASSISTLLCNGSSQSPNFSVSFIGNSIGTYPLTINSLNAGNINYITDSSNKVNITVKEYGLVGGFVSGKFIGTAKSVTNNQSYPVQGSFRIKRTQ